MIELRRERFDRVAENNTANLRSGHETASGAEQRYSNF